MTCFGNAGGGSPVGSVPTTMNNWDMTFSKSFPLGSEKRTVNVQLMAYNVFNHTQFSGINTSVQYDLTAWQKGTLTQTNNQLGRFSSARSPRTVTVQVRLQF